jgi:hypothetical protein
MEEAERLGVPLTRLIPTAAEFVSGPIVPLYQELKTKHEATRAKGPSEEAPPDYPEPKKGRSADDLRALRAGYWRWFADNFSATRAMVTVESAATEHGRISWIDYRLPLTNEGDTLHLHVCPRGKYDTGVLAYNLIKRGFKHGIRLVGTLKAEPDMNVLAIYEK